MISVIQGCVLSCNRRTIKGRNGQADSYFYEYGVDFGDGVVIFSGGVELSIGNQDFKISPKGMYDRMAKIKPINDNDISNLEPSTF